MANSRLCSIHECGKKHYGRGFCRAHWERWKSHDDPLAGRIANFAAKSWIDTALAAETDECLIWPYATNRGGYGVVRYEGRTFIVSELVCIKSHGPDETGELDAAHSCNTRLCGNKRHLSWKTRTDNMADAVEAETWRHGEQINGTILREDDVRRIRSMLGTLMHKEIAAMYGVTRETITAISVRRSWAWLD